MIPTTKVQRIRDLRAKGQSYKEIAKDVNISLASVAYYLSPTKGAKKRSLPAVSAAGNNSPLPTYSFLLELVGSNLTAASKANVLLRYISPAP